jgi:hypothetical protein
VNAYGLVETYRRFGRNGASGMATVERAMLVYYVVQKYFIKDLAFLERLYQDITIIF